MSGRSGAPNIVVVLDGVERFERRGPNEDPG
jgi:hypothetical protein